ncbi:hypothetical protein Tco_0528702 [Tanacetum coccineum]
MLNVGSTVGSFDKQALETELTQLKDAITSVRIQNDGFKVENENVKRRYKELSKSNAYSRSTFTAKINALTAENAKLKTELRTPGLQIDPHRTPTSAQNKKTNVPMNQSTKKTKPCHESRYLCQRAILGTIGSCQ